VGRGSANGVAIAGADRMLLGLAEQTA
jgi:hypothetical protein